MKRGTGMAGLILVAALGALPAAGCRTNGPGGYSGRESKPARQDANKIQPSTDAQARAVVDSAFAYCSGGMESVKKTFADTLTVRTAAGKALFLHAPDILEMLNRSCLQDAQREIAQIARPGAMHAKAAPGGACRAQVPEGEIWVEVLEFVKDAQTGAVSPSGDGWYIYALRREPGGDLKIFARLMACPE